MTTFIGNKNIPGVLEFLINRLPAANRYFSLFYGSGGIENSVYTSEIDWLASEANIANHKFASGRSRIVANDYKVLLGEIVYAPDDFIFADPPYLHETRRNGRLYYGEHEWDEKDHDEFLRRIVLHPAKVMITHPPCQKYEGMLGVYKDQWQWEDFSYQGHQGKVNDRVWMNYDPKAVELHTYACLGSNFVERQAIKRQRKNIIRKFGKLDPHVRWALIDALRSEELI